MIKEVVLNNNDPAIFTTLLNYYLSSTSFILCDNRNDTGNGVFVRKLQFLTDSYIGCVNTFDVL